MYKFNLLHRGASVVSQIDLFDECHYGADKLFFRGSFSTPQEVAQQVKIALGGEGLDEEKLKEIYGQEITPEFKKEKLGIGNPLAKESEESGVVTVPIIALNRYHIPNKKFWNNTPPAGVKNPYKASNAVTFYIRLYFRDDFGYITFGCPWEEIIGQEDALAANEDGTDLIPHFKLINCHFISKEDAIIVLKELGLDVDEWDKNVITKQVLEILDENGNLITL